MRRFRELFPVTLLWPLFILAGLVCAVAAAQDLGRNNTSPDAALHRTIDLAVNVVLIPVTVIDSDNRYVSGLGKKNFEVWEDKVEQEIAYFSTEDAAMSLGIVLDTSASMREGLANARNNAGRCLAVSDRSDEYSMVLFADKVQPATEFTTDIRGLQDRLLSVKSGGSTALYDAIYEGLKRVQKGNNPRKALVVVTDGYENNSRSTASKLKEAVKESEVQVFAVGNEGDGLLRELTETTGGRSFSSRNQNVQLGSVCNLIVQEMKNQYVLGYKSTNTAVDGKWRAVRVKVNPPAGMNKLGVRAKSGYQGPGSQDSAD